MNVAIVLAGGVGSRVGADVPKQFIEVFGRPILSYTLERLNSHPLIDAIEVVCLRGYESVVWAIAEEGGYDKVKWIVEGGATFQDSVKSGISGLRDKLSDDDLVLIHYGASPFVTDDIVEDAVRVCLQYGNASPARNQTYLIAGKGDGVCTKEYIDRDQVMCLNSPQAFRFAYACWLYEEGERRGLLQKVEPHTTSLMLAMGETIYFSKDSTSNIKITTADDVRLFKGWLLAKSS